LQEGSDLWLCLALFTLYWLAALKSYNLCGQVKALIL
jgi:hypothetical protein